jgi:prolyl-tRNA synthetase
MRYSQAFIPTLKEVPSDAQVVSHVFMVRGGFIRRLAAGIYNFLPLGWRVLHRIESIVREELARAGAQEVLMPAAIPAELWQESGRWKKYGPELLRFKDRKGADFCFGPTHEEVITDMVRREIKSYRQLPVNLYQIQTKFRDEIRPRFGLMRGREFMMKDAYSFHTSSESLDETYRAMEQAYRRIFDACHLDYAAVEADTGNIGGSASHEFMVVAQTGESAVVSCQACGYGANVEKASTKPLDAPPAGLEEPAREVATPGAAAVADVAQFLGVDAARIVKTLIYNTEKGLFAVVIRGDREVNEVKLQNALDVEHLELASAERVEQATGAPVGFAGPAGLPSAVALVADEAVRDMAGFVAGANKKDAHLVGLRWGRDAQPERFVDVLLVTAGDACPRCGGALRLSRGIETGHIFKLGTKYSQAMGCNFTDESGVDQPMVMGCYGLGIGRTVAAAIEQNHDADGIIWPLPLAPFQVLLLSLNPNDEAVRAAADGLYRDLRERGVEVLYDDRDERPGVKFKDADLIGVPVRLTVGGKSLADGKIEVSLRRDRVKHPVPVADALPAVLTRLVG